jgi:hypothetical protein
MGDKKELVTVDFSEVLAEVDKLAAAGATNIKVWEPECSCDAGWALDAEGETYICSSCLTGKQLWVREHPEDYIPF